MKISALAMLSLASVAALGSPVVAGIWPRSNYGFGTFYDDHACGVNAGIAVSMSNPGCLANEFGRNSIYIQPGIAVVSQITLVWSPGSNCECQDDCAIVPANIGATDYCWDLVGHAAAQSFRFLVNNGGCGSNNC